MLSDFLMTMLFSVSLHTALGWRGLYFHHDANEKRGLGEVKKLHRGHSADGAGRWESSPGFGRLGPGPGGHPTRVSREPLKDSVDAGTKAGRGVGGQTSSTFPVSGSLL